ncbi:MAG: hypothetical protein QE285_12670 [Aquabacterium sp.]|nr:hypothetical protein [Aquabacterium sp.]
MVVRLTALPAVSVPVSVITTPAMPASLPLTVPPLSVSSHTRPAMTLLLAISPKWLPAEPPTGRLPMVMALAVLVLPVPGFSAPCRKPAGCT